MQLEVILDQRAKIVTLEAMYTARDDEEVDTKLEFDLKPEAAMALAGQLADAADQLIRTPESAAERDRIKA